MSAKLQEAIKGYLSQGYKIAENHSPTSVTLLKKGLFINKWLFLWTDDHSDVQISTQNFKNLTKKLSEKIRTQRVLEAKRSWTWKCVANKRYNELDSFSRLLVDEEEENNQILEQLKRERAIIENEINSRNLLGDTAIPLKEEIERCLNAGYELQSHTNSSAVLKRHTPHLSRDEMLKLCVGSNGRVQCNGESSKEMQERLNSLISLFKVYRTFKPPLRKDKHFLDKQFELDAEINALVTEMKYLGCSPNLGDYEL
ncbi:MAG: hypothetical protein ABSB25_07865 [Sedimentisphaerales bacterium]|jgi:hypothetical protein